MSIDDDVIISQSVGAWCMEAVKGLNKMTAGGPEEENVFMYAKKTDEGVTHQNYQFICYMGDMPP